MALGETQPSQIQTTAIINGTGTGNGAPDRPQKLAKQVRFHC